MCCRLRLTPVNFVRGGGLFGSNPMTGSIGVFTINLLRIVTLVLPRKNSKNVSNIAKIGKTSEIKRKIVEQQSEKGFILIPATT